MPLGGPQQYLAQYNGYILPGYVQEESFDSQMNMASHYAPYADGSLTEYLGLQNKMLSLKLKVWEQDYISAKDQVQLGATYLRTQRATFAPLYVQYSDRHYDAKVSSIKVQKSVGNPVRILEYDVQFECTPWLIEDTENQISGTGTVTTTGRVLEDGGWTFANVDVSGSNVTISGYTATGDFAGFVSISGSVTNMLLDSENYTATMGGNNRNDLLLTADYRLLVGPGVTNFVVTGASSCTISWFNRWYI